MESRLVRFEGFEGIHLVGDVWGDDGAWPVLLMHGGGQTRHAWGNTAQVLAGNGWRAVSIAMSHEPGFCRIFSCSCFGPSMPSAIVTLRFGHSCNTRVTSGKIRF